MLLNRRVFHYELIAKLLDFFASLHIRNYGYHYDLLRDNERVLLLDFHPRWDPIPHNRFMRVVSTVILVLDQDGPVHHLFSILEALLVINSRIMTLVVSLPVANRVTQL